MNRENYLPILKGLIKHIPGVKLIFSAGTGGTNQPRYCYAIWMRHLIQWNTIHAHLPDQVVELGPGDSLGIGLAALLSGCNRVYALDVVRYADTDRNIQVFEELVELFRQRAAIPDASEYPKVKPQLADHQFPSTILTPERLAHSLAEQRIRQIRRELSDINNPDNTFIHYHVPWNEEASIPNQTIDLVYSQAVLEYVNNLDELFALMSRWLKPAGVLSHTVDFKSHGLTPGWNGHWTLSDFEWKIVKGGQKSLLNREPYSTYVRLHTEHGFSIVKQIPTTLENNLKPNAFAKRFVHLSEEDKTTAGAYFLAQKR